MPFDFDPNCVKADCVKIKLGGQDYFVAPMLLGEILAVTPLLKGVQVAAQTPLLERTAENFAPVVEIVWRGLKRAYPGVTTDDVLALAAPPDELFAALPAILKQGGFKLPEPGEDPATS